MCGCRSRPFTTPCIGLRRLSLLREVVVEPGRSYFDTNSSDHHHFFFEDGGMLRDVPGEYVSLQGVPSPPSGTSISRVDVIIRVRDTGQSG